MVVNFDHSRNNITGINEIILAEPKSNSELREAIQESLKSKNNILITRLKKNQVSIIEKIAEESAIKAMFCNYQRTCILIQNDLDIKSNKKIAIVTGGTSDNYIAEEVKLTLKYFGIESISFIDVGIAGVHRTQEALDQIKNEKTIICIIAIAGNEGALFTYLSGQTKLPIIAVPSPVGYGFGGKGKTALRSALQSCSPGIAVVNIENGFGAAVFAKKLIDLIEQK